MNRPLAASELVGADWIWLVTVTYAGRTFRFATSPVDVTDEDGNTYTWGQDGSLVPPYFEERFPTNPDTVTELSLPVEVYLETDIANLWFRGFRWVVARAEVAVHIPGNAWEDRYVLVSNAKVKAPEFGSLGESVSFTIYKDITDGELFPPASHVISESQLTGAYVGTVTELGGPGYEYIGVGDSVSFWNADANGKVYPFVFGRPGQIVYRNGGGLGGLLGAEDTYPASPAIFLGVASSGTGPDYANWLIAGHHVTATTFVLHNITQGTRETLDLNETFELSPFEYPTYLIRNTVDRVGNEIAIVAMWEGVAFSYDEGDEFAIEWVEDGSYGKASPYRNGPLNRIGELTRFMLEKSGLDVDRASLVEVSEVRTQDVGGYISERIDPWQWIQDNVIPVAEIGAGINGIGVYLAPIGRTPEVRRATVAYLRAGSDVHRRSYLEETAPEANRQSLSYVYSSQGDYHQTATVSGDLSEVDYQSISTSFYARRSVDAFDVLEGAEDESDILVDPVAPWSLLHMSIRRKSYPEVPLTYDAENSLAWIPPGARIRLDDTEVSLYQREMVVAARVWDGLDVSFEFALQDDPMVHPIQTSTNTRDDDEAADAEDGAAATWVTIQADDLGTITDSDPTLNGSVSMSGDNLQIPVLASARLRRWTTGAGIETLWWALSMPSGVIPTSGGMPTGSILWRITPDSIPDGWGIMVGLVSTTDSLASGMGFIRSSPTNYRFYRSGYGTFTNVGASWAIADGRGIQMESRLYGGASGTTVAMACVTDARSYTASASEHIGADGALTDGSADPDNFVPSIVVLREDPGTSSAETISVKIEWAVLPYPQAVT